MPPAILIALLVQAAPPFVAGSPDARAGIIHVGATGIRCARLPCPTRGVFIPDARGHAVRDRLLMADTSGTAPPPPMIGNAAARREIARIWEARGCVAVEGRLIAGEDDRPLLRVDRLVGRCSS
ncbi:hypothetical protein QLH51_03680 [Sphingomonas sp. 2R-10]|uniref:hypothetical protein n=1 Tax=Sphingomonas sp. 2R-10 TaxID=3045148 RepID=UPI000F7A2470|nr:hypothetical protein [Sphingomonas sp. 2R-10]MDJ0275902.1 hypothetical protein [Sphingomonas sp. 2R-10]